VATLANIMGFVYPIGAVVTLGVSTNPGTLYGVGTWTAIEGTVIVGLDSAQTEFDALNETGGAKTHTLTGGESGTSAHAHAINRGSGTQGSLTSNFLSMGTDVGSNGQTDASPEVSADDPHNNLQPYIVKYVWERTS